MKQKAVRAGVSWISLLALMMLLRPTNLPVVILIAPFILLFASLYNTWMLCFALFVRFGRNRLPLRSVQRAGVFVATSLVLLAVLQSLGQLTIRDSLTVLAVVILGFFYAARFRTDAKTP